MSKGNIHGKQVKNLSIAGGKLNIQDTLLINNNIISGVSTPILGTDAVNKDYVDGLSLGGSNQLTVYGKLNLNKPCLVTSIDGDLATSLGVNQIPASGVRVFINGHEHSTPVNAAQFATHECYFVSATNSTVRGFGDEELGDILQWNGSVTGFQLDTDDEVDFIYLISTSGGTPSGGGGGTGGSSDWLGLTDTPANYTGNVDKLIQVNDSEDGIEYANWEVDGNTLKPTIDGSDIGTTSSRISNIFMSSTIDFQSDLIFQNNGSNILQVGTNGTVRINDNFNLPSSTGAGEQILVVATGSGDLIFQTKEFYEDSKVDIRIDLKNGADGGIASLGGDGKIIQSQLPSLVITDTFVVASTASMLGLTQAETGDVSVRTDQSRSYILAGASFSEVGDWQELLSPSGGVLSVNAQIGTVLLDLDSLIDVDTSGVSNGQVLTYNGGTWSAESIIVGTTDKHVDIRSYVAGVTQSITHDLNSENIVFSMYDENDLAIDGVVKIQGTASVDVNLSASKNNVKTIIIG